jgi:hypothetical protein
MTAAPGRRLRRAAALALCGLAVIATAGCGSAASAASLGHSAASAGQRAAGTTAVPVVVVCFNKTQIRPGSYLLACGDGSAYLERLNWTAWGPSSAVASGTYIVNNCTPDCAGGRGIAFGVLAVLWNAQPWPGHAGVRYFTELTMIFTGNRSYTERGKAYQQPQTVTYPMFKAGGAGLLSGARAAQDHVDDLAGDDDQAGDVVARVAGVAGQQVGDVLLAR